LSLKKNVIANFLGQGWTALIGLAFIPLYVKYLGVEAYGLIGVYAMLQAWLSLLDMGMTPTLNREMARYTAGAHTAQSIRNLLRSLEIICFSIAVLCGSLMWAASEWLASDWLQASKLPIETVAQAVAIMGGVAALRFVEGIYRGTILGLQKQVFFNVVNSTFATLRAVGAVAVLAYGSPTIEAYFLWQGVVSVMSVLTLGFVAYGYLPKTSVPSKFSRNALMEVWHFAGGMMATTFLALLLTQVDKVMLSKLLSLETFGYYTLAATVAAAITLLISPITQAFYPRFTELVVKGDTQELIHTYHRSAQLVTVLAAPPALMLIFFNENILLIWLGNSVLAHEISPLLALLALGTLLNVLMHIPYMLTLANGWSGFAFWVNLVAVAVLVPAIYWVTPRYGAMGAAWVLVLLNVGYVFIGIHFMHRHLLLMEKWRWYMQDIFAPILAATLTAVFFRLVQPLAIGRLAEFVWLFITGLFIISSAIIATTELRKSIFLNIARRMKTND
jgi:O-antigen/teichoic acid export membrane protein